MLTRRRQFGFSSSMWAWEPRKAYQLKPIFRRLSNYSDLKSMDETFRKAVAQVEATKKTSVPWKADQPHPQQYFRFNDQRREWERQETGSTSGHESSDSRSPGLVRLALFSWNIDFMLPYAESRMEIGLSTLRDLTTRLPSSTAVVVFFQECLHSDLSTISKQPWVQQRFAITDLTGDNWASGHYGTTTLIDRRLPIAGLFRVHYDKTRMERDALFTDVLMGHANDKKIRLCNTHLESLAMEPPYRPPQVQLFSSYLKEDAVHAGIAAGDFNAIQDFDQSLHLENGLKDAYLERGGTEGSDEGYTWGQQAATSLRDRFGCSRMDKVYFRGGVEALDFKRFGADVQLQDGEERDHLIELGFEKPWITDHLGIKAEFDVADLNSTL